MAIHGIVSTYFGDLEFDIGKSLNWTSTLCDSMYVMDVNNSESSRQYVIDWDNSFSTVKKSFFSQYSFLTSPTTAKNWRKESFNRAKAAWNYNDDDWVMFIDGTEGLNVFHAPPVTFNVTHASVTTPVTIPVTTTGTITVTTSVSHGAAIGNTLKLTGAFLTATVNSNVVTIPLDGTYLVTAVPSSTKISIQRDFGAEINIADTTLSGIAHGSLTTEPSGYFAGNVFKSWIESEITAAVAAGKDFISLDGWALVRSGPPTNLTLTMSQPDLQIKASTATSCEEYYLSMGSMIRIGKVSSFSNSSFDWLTLDQPASSFSNAYAASRLSLISYAYVRWSDNPANMTQSVDASAPNYSSSTPLRPVNIEYDTGYAMRRLISQVRPISGLPTAPGDWSTSDPSGTQPMVGSYKKLDLIYVQNENYVDGGFVLSGYRAYGGSPLYPGILRSNLREGIWYTNRGSAPIKVRAATVSSSSGVVTVNTGYPVDSGNPHYLSAGTKISVYGTDPKFNGTYVIDTVPSSRSFTFKRSTPDTSATEFPIGQVVTVPVSFGPVPWNYLLNTFGIDDPSQWIKYSGPRTI
jgi:hypothetical protein